MSVAPFKRGTIGPLHRDTMRATLEVVRTLYNLSRLGKRESLAIRLIEQEKAKLSEDDELTHATRRSLGITLAGSRQPRRAVLEYIAILKSQEKTLGKRTLAQSSPWAYWQPPRHRFIEAEEAPTRAHKLQTKLLGLSQQDTITTLSELATLKYHQSHLDETKAIGERPLS